MKNSRPPMSRQQITLMFPIVVLVVSIAFYFLWISPETKKLSSARHQTTADRMVTSSLRARITQLSTEEKDLQANGSYLYRFSEAIPSEPNAPLLVVQLYQLSQKASVSLQSVTDDVVTATKNRDSEVPVTIVASGGHNALFAFLKGLYSLPRLITVQSLSISGAGDLNASGARPYTASIVATAFTTELVRTPSLANGP